jgi:molecular chaperone HtpG
MMTDDKFLEKANKFLVMEDTTGKFHTIEEYKTATEILQKNKDGKQVILYTTNPVQQDAYVQACTSKGYTVVKMETLVDAAFINTMEMKWENVSFVRVDADIVDNLIDKQEGNESILNREETEKLKELFTLPIDNLHVTTEIKGLSPQSAPVVATRPEFMRRMKDMGAVGGGMTAFYAQMPDEVTLTVNGNHPIYQTLLKETNEDVQLKQVRNLADLALLSQGLLKGNELTNFINRSVELMQGENKVVEA